ncbi:hypothetical protein GQ53DRAFT_781293 [Thozetella sp. PMI_491]|nr:hypothetical protein GQ53DRAFT_781293 [Thozetella sp. PMI_491]
MSDEEQANERVLKHKLQLIQSPVVFRQRSDLSATLQHAQTDDGVNALGYRDGKNHDCPEFQKYEEATNIELFYDLFFAANLGVFSGGHAVANNEELHTYIGYFCMLWFTWALVGLFDVRFVTDSIFERLARAVHLGVMVGFAVVAPNFNPTDDADDAALAIILLVSRLALSVQYATILWHVREHRRTWRPLNIMIWLNLASAFVYLGIAFGLKTQNSRGYIAWYVMGGVEVALTAGLSLFWDVLSFEGTHLINRMSLLTFIIIGEGVNVVASCITLIVKNPEAWTSPTIGTVTAAIATLYIVYQIYFDWMRHLHLPRYRQLAWALIHFPFQLVLTLFVEGAAQLALWAKAFEVLNWSVALFGTMGDDLMANVTTRTKEEFTAEARANVDLIFSLYPITSQDTSRAVEDAFATLNTIPADWWTNARNSTDANMAIFEIAEYELLFSIFNSLLASFEIQPFDNITGVSTSDEASYQQAIYLENGVRFKTVFYYSFVAAGSVIILLNILFVVSRTEVWRPWHYIRTAINILMGIGLCLVSLVLKNTDMAANYGPTPWVLPTACLTFFVMLIFNHLPHPPPVLFRR